MPQSGITASVRHAASVAAGVLGRHGVGRGSSSDEGARQTLTIAAPAGDDAARGHQLFEDEDGCVRAVFRPHEPA